MAASTDKKSVKSPIFEINLLHPRGEQPRIYAQLMQWLIVSGRYIVIFVEIIVISAFVLRYKLDTDIADLTDQIKSALPYIQSLQKDEAVIRTAQFQLQTIENKYKARLDYPKIISKVASLTPQSIRLTNISVDSSQSTPSISLSGNTPSNRELSAFIKALTNETTFSEITLSNIAFEGETTFSITGKIQNIGGEI